MEFNDMGNTKPTVLYFFDHFYPAYKSGGPARSSLALIENMREHLNVKVITNASDFGESKPLEHIIPDHWNQQKSVSVYYSTGQGYWKRIWKVIRDSGVSIYHLNSLFSPRFTILPILAVRIGLLPQRPIILAPRGECSPAALQIKAFKKKIYLLFFHFLRKNIIFHATTEREKGDILNLFKLSPETIRVAPNLRSPEEYKNLSYRNSGKSKGLLRLIFVARISPIKNLEFCIEVLKRVRGNVQFDWYGIAEDKTYLQTVESRFQEVGNNIQCRFMGEIKQEDVIEQISKYDLLFFPSKSENFGHVILESFMASRPVLISDQTYWRGLASNKSGWDLPLEDPGTFAGIIDQLVEMDRKQFEEYTEAAFNRGMQYLRNEENIWAYRNLYGSLYEIGLAK